MRQPSHSKNRSRGRGRRQGANQANRVYDSNGPDVRVRGTAQTVADKYLQLARDAQSAGDGVKAESYFQHAEHYLRIIAAQQAQRQQRAAEQAAAQESEQRDQAAEKEKESGDAKSAANGSGNGKDTPDTSGQSDTWQGHQPEFLQKPVDEPDADKPAKAKRSSKSRKPKAVSEVSDEAAT